jgi:hypothetical protein
MLHKRGTMSLVGLPPGELRAADLRRRAECENGARLDRRHAQGPAGGARLRRRGKGSRHLQRRPLDNINAIFSRLKHGDIEGRVVMRIAAERKRRQLGASRVACVKPRGGRSIDVRIFEPMGTLPGRIELKQCRVGRCRPPPSIANRAAAILESRKSLHFGKSPRRQ